MPTAVREFWYPLMTHPGIPPLPPPAVPVDGALQATFEVVLALLATFALLTLAVLLVRAIGGKSFGRGTGGPDRGPQPPRRRTGSERGHTAVLQRGGALRPRGGTVG